MNAHGGTWKRELIRTAEMLVDIAKGQGVYFVVALLLDSSYDIERLRALLPVLHDTPGAIRKGA